MKTKFGAWLFLAIVISSLSGCAGMFPAPTLWSSDPSTAVAQVGEIKIEITPSCNGYGCKSFMLKIDNKSASNVEINWNKTLFIDHGQTNGGFMFEGVVYTDRNNPKSPDIVFSNGQLAKTIWPNNNVSYASGKYGGWRHGRMSAGQNGAYVSLVINGQEVNESMFVNLSAVQQAATGQ